MESPPMARYIPHKSKKRVFPGGGSSSSSYLDPEVVEIAPPMINLNRSAKSKSLAVKDREIICHEVIDVDMDEESGDVVLIEAKFDTKNKGKLEEALSTFSSASSDGANIESKDGVQSSKKTCTPESKKVINVDVLNSDLSHGDDDYMDLYSDDFMIDDEYAILQSHFDSIDIPPGVEAPIPWLSAPTQSKSKLVTGSSSAHSNLHSQFAAAGNPPVLDPAHPWLLPQPAQKREKPTSFSTSKFQTQAKVVSHSYEAEHSLTSSLAHPPQNKKSLAAASSSTYSSSQQHRNDMNFPSWGRSLHGRRKTFVSSGKSYYVSHDQVGGMKPSPGIEQFGNGNNYMPMYGGDPFGGIPFPPMPKIHNYHMVMNKKPSNAHLSSALPFPVFNPFDSVHEESAYDTWIPDPVNSEKSASGAISRSSTSMEKYGSEEEILKKFQLFKNFDTVEDHQDHHYSHKTDSLHQPAKNWAKKIQDEWKILEKDLPDSIFVRVYESRMDLLRAVIVGAEGTPYHDGLFFFDLFFPRSYPSVPPLVYYHSGGLRLNPNLYNCGKVCLSLLGTWSGSQKEKWIPGVSTMLQVLVSIQGLILNAKPYFNEPAYAHTSGSASGEISSLQYNENTFILSLRTMVYTMKKPPKHFEDLVVGHFCTRARDILVACKAYMDGAQVGCLVRGGVQDVDEGDKSCSQHFKNTLAGFIRILVNEFIQVGAKDCEKFLSLAEMVNKPASPVPNANSFYQYGFGF